MLMQETTPRLGPARVVDASGRRVRLEDGSWAEVALAYPYAPREGDLVLTISQEERSYVIGVLRGTGPTVLSFPADVRISAPNGTLAISSGKAVTVSAPTVETHADRIEMLGRTLVQKVADAYHWVRGFLHVRAGNTRTLVEGTSIQRAERSFVLADKEVRVDADRINLG